MMTTMPWTSRWVYSVTLDFCGDPSEPMSGDYETKTAAMQSLSAHILPATLWRKRAGAIGWEIVTRRSGK